jgi:Cu-Zn family superoxide dismutase
MYRTAPVLLLVAALATGCADTDGVAGPGDASASPSGMAADTDASSQPAASSSPDANGGGDVAASPAGAREARGTFAGYSDKATAVTYDPAVVPPGAAATLTITPVGGGVAVKLSVRGLLARRAYGAHLHTSVCGPTPAEAGPHYQHHPDPAAVASPPSVDPSYANPTNEVWVDVTTDGKGAGTAAATQRWPFDRINPPRSLVLHAGRTATSPGKAGTAGPRVACLTLPA